MLTWKRFNAIPSWPDGEVDETSELQVDALKERLSRFCGGLATGVLAAVLYGSGYSLPNALVIIERIDGEKKFKQERVTIDGGEFSFRLKAEKAKYRITASARGFQPNSLEIEIDGDEARNIALTLQKAN